LSQNRIALFTLLQFGTPNEIGPSQPVERRLPTGENLRQHHPVSGLNEFIGIKGGNPVSAKFIDRHPQQQCHVLVLHVPDRWFAQNNKITIDRLQLLQDFVGAVAAAIIEHNNLVEVLNVMANKRLNNIDLVLYTRDSDQFH
jgi:hypothetical protein